MCGVIGIYRPGRDSVPALFEGLERMEYRGYDSAGVAVVDSGGQLARRRAAGRLSALRALLEQQPLAGGVGIGHTRWATHGAVNETNAHPLISGNVALVHNGIIENEAALRAAHPGLGNRIETETDTELALLLYVQALEAGATSGQALHQVLDCLEGAFALLFLVIEADGHPVLLGAQNGAPLAVGLDDSGAGEHMIGSDGLCLAGVASQVCYLEPGDRVRLDGTGLSILDAAGGVVQRAATGLSAGWAHPGRGRFRHYTEKEMFDQPEVIAGIVGIWGGTGQEVSLPEALAALCDAERLVISGCGSACHAARIGRIWIERFARMPVQVEFASELVWRDLVWQGNGAGLVISQSGETADTLAAMREIRRHGWPCHAVVNVPGSAIAREADGVMESTAGPEIGVAATKTFLAQLAVMAFLALGLAHRRGLLDGDGLAARLAALRLLPDQIGQVLGDPEPCREAARALTRSQSVQFLGRDVLYPLALEGALKMMEIAYLSSAAFAGGEMKHGPLAMIEPGAPVVAMVHSAILGRKMEANLAAVRSRGAQIWTISDTGVSDTGMPGHGLPVPASDPLTAPFLMAVRLQQLAYETALLRGEAIDQPRNLAKSLTVE